MAKVEQRKVTPKQRSRQNYKWFNYLSNDIDDIKKDNKTTKKEMEELKERVTKLEQHRCKCSGNNSS